MPSGTTTPNNGLLVSTLPISEANVTNLTTDLAHKVPIANTTGVTIDTTTYSDPIKGSGKLTTIVFPADQGAIAIALTGDAFPRWLMASDSLDGLYIGNGTTDPYTDGVAITRSGLALTLEGGSSNVQVGGGSGSNRASTTTTVSAGLVVSAAALDPPMVAGGSGAPAIGGNAGDLFIRTDPPDVNHYLYRCTVAGTAGNATWVALGGLT